MVSTTTICILWLLGSGLAFGDESGLNFPKGQYLVHFTRSSPPCEGCLIVKPWVEALKNQGHAILTVDYAFRPEVFTAAGIESIPKFILVDVDDVGFPTIRERIEGKVTPQRLATLAPIAPKGWSGAAAMFDAVPTPNGGEIAVRKNELPPPPPPVVDHRRDVPDVEKTERIKRLEMDSQAKDARISRLEGQLSALGARITSLEAALAKLATNSGPAFCKVPTGYSDAQIDSKLEALRTLANRPIVLDLYAIDTNGTPDDASDDVQTFLGRETYPRGTPVNLRFHESILRAGDDDPIPTGSLSPAE